MRPYRRYLGIGLETARHFLREGARVAITGRHSSTLYTVRKDLGADVRVIASDAGDVASQNNVAEAIRQSFGALDILFINAGLADLRPIEQFDETSFDRSLAIILKGPYFLIQAMLPVFATPTSIVLNGSFNAHIGMPGTSV